MLHQPCKPKHTIIERGRLVFRKDKKSPRIHLPDFDSPKFWPAYREALYHGRRTTPSPAAQKKIQDWGRISDALARGLAAARRRRGATDITLDWLRERVRSNDCRCEITGIRFFSKASRSTKNPYAPSIDRVDCTKGYTQDNVRVVLFAVNVMLMDWGTDVLDHIVSSYQRFRAAARR